MIRFKKKKPHILLIACDPYVDIVLSLPMVTALRQSIGNATLSILIHQSNLQLAQLNPDLDAFFVYDPKTRHGGIHGFWQLVREFKQKKIDVAIAIQDDNKLAFLLFYLLVPHRIGPSGHKRSLFYNYRIAFHKRQGLDHQTMNYLRLLLPLGIKIKSNQKIYASFHINDQARNFAQDFTQNYSLGDYLVIEPMGQKNILQWPKSAMADLIYNLYKRLEISLVLIGSESFLKELTYLKEKVALPQKEGKTHSIIILTDPSLANVAAVIQRASVLISQHTGLHYLSVALGTPAISIFPPFQERKPSRFAPYGPSDFFIVYPNQEECKQCLMHKCPEYNCLAQISPEIMLEEIQKLLEKQKRRRGEPSQVMDYDQEIKRFL